MKQMVKIAGLLFFLGLAVDAQAAIDSAGIFDSVLARYQSAATGWASYIVARASWLFWTLATISMVWTFGMLALKKADIGEFFAEFVRFTIFTGLFWWLLTNGPTFATSIYDSLRQIGSNASGLSGNLTPSSIVDVGFDIFYKVMDQSSVWSPVDSMAGILMSLAILITLALVSVNMLLLLASGWILAYAGVFFLGFGGSRWTSDMAINYYKTVLGVATQLMTMVLLVGIGRTFLDDYYTQMSAGLNLKEMGVMMVVALILLALVNKVPGMISGIITGASIGHAGIGNFGAGAAVGAVGMATAAAATGGAMAAAGAANVAGGAQAVFAAISQGRQNVDAGTDTLSNMFGGNNEGRNDHGDYSQAAGFNLPGGSSSSDSGSGNSGSGSGNSGSGSGSGSGNSSSGSGNSSSGSGNSSSSSSSSGNSGNSGSGNSNSNSSSSSGNSGNGNSGNSGNSGSGNSGNGSNLLSQAARAGKIAVDAAANLAAGTAAVAQDKVEAMREEAAARISDTVGGKIASAIADMNTQPDISPDTPSAPTEAPVFSGNSLGGSQNDDQNPESGIKE